MGFFYNGVERLCPVFVPGREMLPCQRHACLAYEERNEYYEEEKGKPQKYEVSYCHALKKDLDFERAKEEGEPNAE